MWRKKVRCMDCGCLCVKQGGGFDAFAGARPPPPVRYLEIPPELRRSTNMLEDWSNEIRCYRGIVSFGDREEVVQEIAKMRVCRYFVEHIPGFDPSWHVTEQEKRKEQGAIRRWNLLSNLLSVLLGSGVTILAMWLWQLWGK